MPTKSVRVLIVVCSVIPLSILVTGICDTHLWFGCIKLDPTGSNAMAASAVWRRNFRKGYNGISTDAQSR
ncbi:hypothetical protein PGTUg99_026417 [Puccinia graminis f. sp. tritici]|uniref:Uncharacterized protein n=1 Tax=Puccinia graminis f. sp. tritici TaxID=56615 RepID=A0A5B0QRW4_PUCGR|nr:hypothetical protein PGTUg99_026417 [Puccinia graminis f. sp. tritici]